MAERNVSRPFDLNKVNPKFAYSLSNGNTDYFTITPSARIIVFTVDSSSTKCGLWAIWSVSSGSTSYKALVEASDITMVGGQNDAFTVTKANGGYLTYLIFELNNSKMNIVESL